MLYSLVRLTVVLAVAHTGSAFAVAPTLQPISQSSHLRAVALQLSAAAAEVAPCGCAAADAISMNDVSVSGRTLRSTELKNVGGDSVPVSSLIGEDGKAVVVFLRHLG